MKATLTTAEVAAGLRVDPATVRRMVGRGQLPATRVGAQLRFDPDELAATFAANRVQPVQPQARQPVQQRAAAPVSPRGVPAGSVRDKVRARRGA